MLSTSAIFLSPEIFLFVCLFVHPRLALKLLPNPAGPQSTLSCLIFPSPGTPGTYPTPAFSIAFYRRGSGRQSASYISLSKTNED